MSNSFQIDFGHSERKDGIHFQNTGWRMYNQYDLRDMETVDSMVSLVKKYLKKDESMITFGNFNYENHSETHGYKRIVRDFCGDSYSVVSWKYNDYGAVCETYKEENWKPTEKSIRKIISECLKEWYEMLDEEEHKEDVA